MTTLDEYLKRTGLPGAGVTPIQQAALDFEEVWFRTEAVTGSVWPLGGELLAMLRELEWVFNPAPAQSFCPTCGVVEPLGYIGTGEHRDDCRLDALLRRYRR